MIFERLFTSKKTVLKKRIENKTIPGMFIFPVKKDDKNSPVKTASTRLPDRIKADADKINP